MVFNDFIFYKYKRVLIFLLFLIINNLLKKLSGQLLGSIFFLQNLLGIG